MSIRTRTVLIPATTREEVETVTCDLCRKTVHPADTERGGTVDWVGGYNIETTTVSMSTGYSYHETTSVDYTIFHICPQCFRDKLMPWLATQGAKPTEGDDGF